MSRLKFAAASIASAAIMILTPAAAHADACGACYGGCIDAYGDDNSESGFYWLSVCFNGCLDETGSPCMAGAPGGG